AGLAWRRRSQPGTAHLPPSSTSRLNAKSHPLDLGDKKVTVLVRPPPARTSTVTAQFNELSKTVGKSEKGPLPTRNCLVSKETKMTEEALQAVIQEDRQFDPPNDVAAHA